MIGETLTIEGNCYSENDHYWIAGFSDTVTEKELYDNYLTDFEWMGEWIGDSFNENYREIEPGMRKAIHLYKEGKFDTLKDALFNVFGHFYIEFRINGVKKKIDYDFDLDDALYPMIEATSEIL